ncbi:leukocyte immunoglobulin-like receptor subfamily A member 2 [Mauremys reevesii]|uniref:leukocyte immunoglobulin-like receptor subfamily A member 2 n=1 Tax=Mauremys reevesii TaxID=260615 RepID=UPI00193F3F94|nr:leukocyte immunoglobulin-like receptor subfamily A member 2 [Mauremys reevesii]
MGRKGPSASRASWGCSPRRSSSFRSHSGLRLSGAQPWGVGGSSEGPPTAPSWRLLSPSSSSVSIGDSQGCWLAGQSGVLGEGSYPKPSISVSPGGVIPFGGNVTIRCQHQLLGKRILLYKDGDRNYLNYTDPAGSEAEFPITSARRDHGGSYTCRYIDRRGPAAFSEPSDPVQIIVADPSLPRPSISLSPTGVTAPGADVTIRCQGQRRDVRFFLHKAGDLNPQRHMDPAGARAKFRIPTVGRQHGGSYSCSYRPRSEPFVSSQPSDSVQLVVAGGTNPTQPGAAPAPTRPGSTGSGGESPLNQPWKAHAAQGAAPRGWGWLGRTGAVTPGGAPDFTYPNIARLGLSAGVLLVLGLILTEAWNGLGQLLQLLSENLGKALALRRDEMVLSVTDDPCEAETLGCWLAGQSRVSGEGSYPKPSISVSPGGVIPLGGNVTIRCWHQRLGKRILLYRDGYRNPLNYSDPAGSEAEFPITSARWEHGGSYTCRYSNRSVRAAYSEPSDPVQIIVADPILPRPSISLSPTGVTAPGADVTIQCQGQLRDVRFFLHKAGDLNQQQHMDPAGVGAEFHIPSVGQQHRGSYSCSYRPRSKPFVSSQPSDPVQLVVAAAPPILAKTGSFPTEGTNATQPGAAPAPTRPGSTGPAATPGRPDFTNTNIARLVLSAAVLLVLGLILAEACYSRPREVP